MLTIALPEYFTAPCNCDEMYVFSWTTLSVGIKYFITDIVRNGHVLAYNFTDGRCIKRIVTSSSHASIKMKKDQTVWNL